jgi:hypothetical protein
MFSPIFRVVVVGDVLQLINSPIANTEETEVQTSDLPPEMDYPKEQNPETDDVCNHQREKPSVIGNHQREKPLVVIHRLPPVSVSVVSAACAVGNPRDSISLGNRWRPVVNT